MRSTKAVLTNEFYYTIFINYFQFTYTPLNRKFSASSETRTKFENQALPRSVAKGKHTFHRIKLRIKLNYYYRIKLK